MEGVLEGDYGREGRSGVLFNLRGGKREEHRTVEVSSNVNDPRHV